METKHTPGPWTIGQNTIDTFGDVRRGHISIDAIRWGSFAICYRHEINETDDECIANAKLIAAAPDMLEALIKAKRMYEEVEPVGGYQGVYKSICNSINKAIK
jgi:hypothetical protein